MDPLTHLPLAPPVADFGPTAAAPPDPLEAFIVRCREYQQAAQDVTAAPAMRWTPEGPLLGLAPAERAAVDDCLQFVRVRLGWLESAPSRRRAAQHLVMAVAADTDTDTD